MQLSTPPATLDQLIERTELFHLVQSERISRDTAKWDDLTACYWPETSRVRVTWFDGSAEEFVERSRTQVEKGKGKGLHEIVPIRAEIVGDRALVDSRGTIMVRAMLHGIESDFDHWCRFLSRAERREGEWRLCQFDAIYGRDRVQAVRPDQALPIDWSIAEPLRESYRWLAYLNVANGYPYDDQLPGDDRPDLRAEFEAEAGEWLAQGH